MQGNSNIGRVKAKPTTESTQMLKTYQGEIIKKTPSHIRPPIQREKIYKKILTEQKEKETEESKLTKPLRLAFKTSSSDIKKITGPIDQRTSFQPKPTFIPPNDKLKKVKRTYNASQKLKTQPDCQVRTSHRPTQSNDRHQHDEKVCFLKVKRQPLKSQLKPQTQQSSYLKSRLRTQGTFDSTPSQVHCNDIEIVALIGQGTFGKVFKGLIRKTGQSVAVKRVFQDPKYKNREVQIVNMLKGDFVMKVLTTYNTYEEGHQYLNIVMDFYDGDLFAYIAQQGKKSLPTNTIKLMAYQIFRGLMYTHALRIAHRDIKPHNLLYKNKRVVLCDFGSAKILTHQPNLPYICSRCYRAPQLIFGATHYTTMVDVWSVGCVLLEMLHSTPLFIGDTSIDHLIEIIKVLGTPTKTQVIQMNPDYDLTDYKFPKIKKRQWQKIFPKADPLLLDLINQVMVYSPKERLTAAEAVAHEFFDELREEAVAENIRNKYDLDLFTFTKEQLRGNEHLLPKIIPQWVHKKHY